MIRDLKQDCVPSSLQRCDLICAFLTGENKESRLFLNLKQAYATYSASLTVQCDQIGAFSTTTTYNIKLWMNWRKWDKTSMCSLAAL